jgi:hypothetical protein
MCRSHPPEHVVDHADALADADEWLAFWAALIALELETIDA